MKIIKLILISLSFFVLSNCNEKDDPIPIVANPIPEFYITGILGMNKINVKAGEQNYFMNTRDTFFEAPLNTYKFISDFGPYKCPKCTNSFTITINDFKANTNGNPSYIDSVLVTGKYLFYSRPFTASYGRVFVGWLNPNGVLYHTENTKQPTGNRFQIVSVEEYKPNELGHKTKKVKANFSCRLYSLLGDSIEFNSVETVFAVSYPD